jgi:hypothetical protein
MAAFARSPSEARLILTEFGALVHHISAEPKNGRKFMVVSMMLVGIHQSQLLVEAPRVGRLVAGQKVRWLSSYRRWDWVEVLDRAGRPTGRRGWLYQRVTQSDF